MTQFSRPLANRIVAAYDGDRTGQTASNIGTDAGADAPDWSEILAEVSRLWQGPEGGIPLAMCFTRALGAHATRNSGQMIAMDWLIGHLADFPREMEGIALSHALINETVAGDPDEALPVLVFADGSFLYSDMDGLICELDLNLGIQGVEDPFALEACDDLVILGATPGYRAAHGAPEDRLIPFGDAEISVVGEIGSAIADAEDPPVDDLSGEANWSAQDVVVLDETLTEAWLVLLAPQAVQVTVRSGFDDEEGSEVPLVDVFACGEPSSDEEAALAARANRAGKRFLEILAPLVDLDMLDGYTLEYADGDRERMSGYMKCSREITDLCLLPEDFSAHERLAAPKKLRARLARAGVEPDAIKALLASIA